MNENIIFITARESGDRVDALLAHNIESLSRNAAQKCIENSAVLLNGVPIKKNYKCAAGDIFEIHLPEPENIKPYPQNIPINIVYEDDDVIVINKDRGMVVHPAPGHPDGTLVNALLYHCGENLSTIGGEFRPGIVHRIDKDTSGLLIAAKNNYAHEYLSAQLADRSLSRTYEAIVRGNMKEPSGIVDKPIGRHPTDRKRMAVTDIASKPAVTYWELINNYKSYSHIRCKLKTGRTHQIRVHMASLGHPLLGDFTYGSPSPEKGLEGQCLHARKIKFIHPKSHEEMEFETELPEYFQQVMLKLGPAIG